MAFKVNRKPLIQVAKSLSHLNSRPYTRLALYLNGIPSLNSVDSHRSSNTLENGEKLNSPSKLVGVMAMSSDAGLKYETHIPTSIWQKGAIAAGSALGALTNPARADLVAALGETTGILAYERMAQRMRVDQEGRAILKEKPRVTSASVGHAWDLPEKSFGAAYAQFMGSRIFSADDRPPVRFVDDPELAYVAARAREVHDFWHVLFGCPTTVSGELSLKMVEWVQTGLPMCFFAVLGGPVRLSVKHRNALRNTFYPWAVSAARQAPDLMCIYYEKYFELGLEEVRKKWRITPAPKM